MKVLVTGANGFVGSHITEKLLEAGHFVRCLVRKTSNLRWLEGLNVEYIYGDVNDVDSLGASLQEIDAVVHNAGILRATESSQYYKVNSEGTENIISCAPSGVKKIVHISSLAAYGPSYWDRTRKFSETPAPVSDYGRSKLSGETVIKKNQKIPWVVIVPSAVYGPRDKDMFSFFKLVQNGFAINTSRKRLINLTYVEDVADAAVKSIKEGEFSGETFYIAHEQKLSWLEICETLSEIMGKKIRRVTLPEAVFKIAAFISEKAAGVTGRPAVFNTQKADEMLQPGWTLEDVAARDKLKIDLTDFYSGAQKTYNWYKKNGWL